MFEVNAEIIKGRVYFSCDDLVRICNGSISDKGSPFDFALKSLVSQLKNMETEALANTQGELNESISNSHTTIP